METWGDAANAPVQSPETTDHIIEERLVYDGARRVQETRRLGRFGGGGCALRVLVDEQGNPRYGGTINTGTSSSCSFVLSPTLSGTNQQTLARRYVWGPGDQGSQELLAYYDAASGSSSIGAARWVIQDAQKDVVGVADLGATAQSGTNLPRARVVAGYEYDAYGVMVRGVQPANTSAPPPVWVGHQGLFVEAPDVPVGDIGATATGAASRLAWGAAGGKQLYFAANRVLAPSIGRWLQVDPNASGQVVIGSIAHGGAVMGVAGGASEYDLKGRFGDGANLYQYVRGNPLSGSDPTGLVMWGSWDDTLQTGLQVAGLVQGVLGTHQLTNTEAIDWATDMSRPDGEIEDLSGIANSIGGSTDSEVDSIAGPYAPLIAGGADAASISPAKALQAMKGFKVFRGGMRVSKSLAKWFKDGPANVMVYTAKMNGKLYVGITKDKLAREAAHGVKIKEVSQTLFTRRQARAIESLIIQTNREKQANKILSISGEREVFGPAIEWAKGTARRLGIQIHY